MDTQEPPLYAEAGDLERLEFQGFRKARLIVQGISQNGEHPILCLHGYAKERPTGSWDYVDVNRDGSLGDAETYPQVRVERVIWDWDEKFEAEVALARAGREGTVAWEDVKQELDLSSAYLDGRFGAVPVLTPEDEPSEAAAGEDADESVPAGPSTDAIAAAIWNRRPEDVKQRQRLDFG